MSVSEVSIANRALQMLGEDPIEALSQSHPNAREMALAYDPIRRRLLRMYGWNFAKARAALAADTSQTVWGSLNRFELPNDFLCLQRPSDARVDWSIEGRFIVTKDGGPLYLSYIADESNPANFDAAFAEVFSTQLAFETCERITGSTAKKAGLRADLKALVMDARLANAFERDADVPLEDDFILAML